MATSDDTTFDSTLASFDAGLANGMEGVVKAVSRVLEAHVPGELDRIRARLGLPAWDPDDPHPDALPPVNAFHAEDRARIDEDLPAVITNGRRVRSIRPMDRSVDYDGGVADVYRFRYRVRIYAFVDGDEFVSTARRRDRLTLACRNALLVAGAMSTRVTLRPEDWLEEHSDVGTFESGRYGAMAYLEVDLDADEYLPLPAAGTIDTTEATVHPALD